MKKAKAPSSSTVTVLNGSVAISAAMRRVRPKRIAVAYLGNGVLDLIPEVEDLESVIIWPTVGTQPLAVKELAKRFGGDWDRIHFHSSLHAKMYLGADSAIVGSANWTEPGLRDLNREEVCLEVNDPLVLQELEDLYQKLVHQAKIDFSNTKAKTDRLIGLQVEIDYSLPSVAGRTAVDLLDYANDGGTPFHIGWYDEEGVLSESTSTIGAESIKSTDGLTDINQIEYYTPFGIGDSIELGDWIFVWPKAAVENGSTHKGDLLPYWWMKVDRIVKYGTTYKEYPHLAYMHPRLIKRRLAEAPFKITKEAISAFHEVIGADEKLKSFALQSEDGFRFKKLTRHIPTLVKKMQEVVRATKK
jgi:hypothetical protein